MAWWNDTWLNEAFATWMEQKLTAEWKPEWQTRVADQEQRLFAMGRDSLVSARRINQPAETKSDIANAFDSITYVKGGSVLRMFESAMGEQKFRSGVQAYLKQYTFGNARAEDFQPPSARPAAPKLLRHLRRFSTRPACRNSACA